MAKILMDPEQLQSLQTELDKYSDAIDAAQSTVSLLFGEKDPNDKKLSDALTQYDITHSVIVQRIEEMNDYLNQLGEIFEEKDSQLKATIQDWDWSPQK